MLRLLRYLIYSGLERIMAFVERWYVASFVFVFRSTTSLLESIDRGIAVKVSYHFLFKPLYGQENFTGYVFGFIFRAGRIIGGLLAYAVILIIASLGYLIWAALPALIVLWGFTNK